MTYPPSIKNLISQFSKLPGIGPKTAERLVFFLLAQTKKELLDFGGAIEHILEKIKICQNCFNFSETDPCRICGDQRRDKKVICVVAKPQDIYNIEKTGAFGGVYHLLGGNISPMDGIHPENLKIGQLLEKIKKDEAVEVILSLNPDIEGETTLLYLSKLLKQFPKLKITRLARGLPMGADLEYADEITLENALKSRQQLN